MHKVFLFVLLSGFLTTSFPFNKVHAATFRVPLLYGIETIGGYYFRPVSDFNYELEEKNKPLVPEELVIVDPGQASRDLDLAVNKIEKAIKTLNKQNAIPLNYIDFTALNSRTVPEPSCYTGEATSVPSLIEEMRGDVIHKEFKIRGWKYKKAIYLDGISEDRAERDFPTIWKNWRGYGEAILVIYNDIPPKRYHSTLIRRCAN